MKTKTEQTSSAAPVATAGIKKVFTLAHGKHNEVYIGFVCVNLISAKDIFNKNLIGCSDPFPIISVGRHKEEGAVSFNNLSPVWNTEFLMPWDGAAVLKIELADQGKFDDVYESLGFVEMSLVLFEIGQKNVFDIPLRDVVKGTIQFEVTIKVLE